MFCQFKKYNIKNKCYENKEKPLSTFYKERQETAIETTVARKFKQKKVKHVQNNKKKQPKKAKTKKAKVICLAYRTFEEEKFDTESL